MKTGTISLSFKDGIVVDAAVGGGFVESYRRLFERARTDLLREKADVDIGVCVVVFGCMPIEASATSVLESLLVASSVPAPARAALVAAVERSPVVHKLEVIAGFDKTDVDRQWLGNVGRAFTIRNKLAHFREHFVSVPVPADVHSLESWLDEIPEADLVRELRRPLIEKTSQALETAKVRLEVIASQYGLQSVVVDTAVNSNVDAV
jgi:hypothetical protein